MIITNDRGNLVYDDESPLCQLIVTSSQGFQYAFMQCLDSDLSDYRAGKAKRVKRYWGAFNHDTKEESIRDIMHYGGKWPDLPAA